MPDFSPSFLLSGSIEFSVPLPSDHPFTFYFFVDIVTITNLFFIIHIHHEELQLYISRILRILSLYFSARIVFYLCCLIYNKHIRVGSAVSGEGLVNVYRGTGRVLMCPVAPTTSLFESTNTMAAKAAAKSSNTFGK